MRTNRKPLYRHTSAALLRAAATPLTCVPDWWPDLDDPASCGTWLEQVWSRPALSSAIRQASRDLAQRVEAIRAGRPVQAKQIRRATVSTVRYVLRATGRPTPFGLFAGVAPATIGTTARVRWGTNHRAAARVDTMWLSNVIDRLEACGELLDRLDVVLNNLAVRRGMRLHVPNGGRHGVSIKYTSAIRVLEDAAAVPVRFDALTDKLAEAFQGTAWSKVRGMLAELVRQGFLITCLRAPLTVTDPLAHLVGRLHEAEADAVPAAVSLLRDLEAVQADVRHHNQAAPSRQGRARDALARRMREPSDVGRTPLAVDLLLDADVQLPSSVADEMERAADALLRLTRQPTGQAVWRDFQAAFWHRYGIGTLVPLKEVVDPAAGLGLPAEYPGSLMTASPSVPSQRDERLLALAWQAVADGSGEIVLTDRAIDALGSGRPFDERYIPPHVEMCARVHAPSTEALQRGDFTLTVTPARSAGTLTSRFTPVATGSGLEEVYRAVPTAVEGALTAQLSFPPLYPHTENVARIPAYLPHVIPLGEHRGADETVTTIDVDDLAVTATNNRLYLVSISRRRVVEPQVLHAMALEKQPPPLARFLAHLPRAFGAAWTGFDWGPQAHKLPYLPRVRYRRTVLSPARWYVTADDLPDGHTDQDQLRQALARWRERCHCPDTVELRDDDRTLRLTLDEPVHTAILHAHLKRHGHAILTEAPAEEGEFGWLGHHVHEIALPLVSTRPPAPSPLTGALPLLTNGTLGPLPGCAGAPWLNAKIYTHPDRYEEIITTHLPQLLTELNGASDWWFVRYRSPHETDHLRLRIRTICAQQQAQYMSAVAQWVGQLRRNGLASGLAFDTYSPEIGRYGPGAAMRGAEAVFVADSQFTAAVLRHLPASAVDPMALVAVNMVDIARGFLGPDDAMHWLASRPAPAATAADRAIVDQAVRLTRHTTPQSRPGWTDEVADTWNHRVAALVSYGQRLPEDTDADAVLESLLHMHHNRLRGIDQEGEKTCRRLARQAALAWRARHEGNDR